MHFGTCSGAHSHSEVGRKPCPDLHVDMRMSASKWRLVPRTCMAALTACIALAASGFSRSLSVSLHFSMSQVCGSIPTRPPHPRKPTPLSLSVFRYGGGRVKIVRGGPDHKGSEHRQVKAQRRTTAGRSRKAAVEKSAFPRRRRRTRRRIVDD